MKNIRWAVIGAGGIADRRMIPAMVNTEGVELVAVMDKSAALAESVGERYGVRHYTDEGQMLRVERPDAVYIATPVFCHKEQCLLALEHGAAVLVEKPITLKSSEAEEVYAAFKSKGVALEVGYMMKHHSLNKRVREIIRDGGIGEVVSIRAQFSCWYPDIPGAWRQTKALGGGGAFMDLGVHALELIEYILGERVARVKTLMATNTFKYEVEDSAIVSFKTESGKLGVIDVNFNIPDNASESKLEFYGDNGYLIARGTLGQADVGVLTHLYAPGGDYEADQNRTVGEPITYQPLGVNIYSEQVRLFSDNLREGRLDYSGVERAVHIQHLVDDIYADAEN